MTQTMPLNWMLFLFMAYILLLTYIMLYGIEFFFSFKMNNYSLKIKEHFIMKWYW